MISKLIISDYQERHIFKLNLDKTGNALSKTATLFLDPCVLEG